METTAQAADRRSDELGKRGEDVAADYLAGTGLVVLSRNWRCREGEVDLIATDGEQLVALSHRFDLVYLWQSVGRLGDELGVTRQRQDRQRLATECGGLPWRSPSPLC